MPETYAEHMRWCKDRALRYVDEGDTAGALASMASDVRKHPDTDNPAINMLLATEGLRLAARDDAEAMRYFIEGFAG